ncbi:MAG: TetR/AcrR family transcriptional regulator, partial [Lachnospiraceae bacterium]
VDDIINLSDTSKGSFYYYFDGKDALLKTLSTILDEWYEELEGEMDSDMNCFEKLLYLNRNIHERMEQKINYELLASLYSTQMVTRGNRNLLDQNRTYYRLITKIVEEGQGLNQISQKKTVKEIVKYYSLCERALVSDWCLSKGEYSLSEYSKEYMPMMLESFRQS